MLHIVHAWTSSAVGLVKSIIAMDVGHPSFFTWKDAIYFFVRYQAWLIAAYLFSRMTASTPFAKAGQAVGDRMARALARYIQRDDGERITAKATDSGSRNDTSISHVAESFSGLLSLLLLLCQFRLSICSSVARRPLLGTPARPCKELQVMLFG